MSTWKPTEYSGEATNLGEWAGWVGPRDCLSCGAMVRNVALHTAWHKAWWDATDDSRSVSPSSAAPESS